MAANKGSSVIKVLFIHHGGLAGGAPLSMLYTMQGILKHGYTAEVGLLQDLPELHKLYNDNGFATHNLNDIPVLNTCAGSEGKWYNPITWLYVSLAIRNWEKGHINLKGLLDKHHFDIVHLNSMTLSNPASYLISIQIPFVWHVREFGPSHKGFRYRNIANRIKRAKEVIFLSKAEQESWVGKSDHGSIVSNFVNMDQFDATASTTDPDRKVLLYVGGTKGYKGIIPLLHSIAEIKATGKYRFTCLMPDTWINQDNKMTSLEKQILRLVSKLDIADVCEFMPFDPDIIDLYKRCDILVFPATVPHFARPVVEASAMGKPVVASRLKAVDELVIDGETGFLIEPNNPVAISDKVMQLFDDSTLAKQMGQAGIQFVRENFEIKSQIKKIVDIYERLLS